MVVIIHGGPFAASPYHMFLQMRQYLLAQGFCLLIVNYRGSLGYGADLMNTLLGNIGINDVDDCGRLTQLALSEFSDVVDPKKVALFGGSHGGFLTAWLAGHPKWCDMWACGVMRNAVLDMNYMSASTDIPDWIHACVFNKPLDQSTLTQEQVETIYQRSPISVVHNVKAPLLIQVGDVDLRVPPHQSYRYMHALKARGVEHKLLLYPGESHPLAAKYECEADVAMNTALWLDKYLN
jgi:acylaminoacyl-peptidase